MRLMSHIIYSFVLAAIFVLPDFIFGFMYNGYYTFSQKSLKESIIILVLSFLILAIKSYRAKLFVSFVFITLSFFEILHYKYFHGLIFHYEMIFFFTQFTELTESLGSVLQYMILPSVIYISQIILVIFIINISKKKIFAIKYVWIMILIFFMVGIISANKRHNISSMMPTNKSYSIVNMYNAISLFLGREVVNYIFSVKKIKKYKDYKMEKITDYTLPKNIIFIMGESLNYRLMHLFGFNMDTTPNLDKLKNDNNFIYKKAFSGGVDTLTAVPTFFLLKREPDNIAKIGKKNTNLISLAKKNGYKVYYVTTQKLNIMAPYNSDADIIKRYKDKDEKMFEIFKDIDFSKKNFIILHQRNSHSPYEASTPKRFYKYSIDNKDLKEYRLNSYANSIRYTDFIINKAINIIKKHKNSILFMTSDHSETFGSKEAKYRYGHGFLNKAVARVPILFYANSVDDRLVEEFRNLKCFNHYTLGKFIAKVLGFKVENPNENDTYFIQGTYIDGTHGFIKYDKNECEKLN
jgi:glucan phosphoethanolaminetransferase (alkaline phosphatase superfamily)